MIQHLIFSNVCVFYGVVGWELLRTGKREKRNTLMVSFFLWACAFRLEGVLGYIGSTYVPREGFVFGSH